ncbi:hypothetical protein [Akkermansia glycaniphila]|uniref:Uncharacterized protein n=1 Tax=Akkermansia glycaniphila TaxID=1679444 RepID=A0A1C7P9G5_9BACT|nr:hypothetical protein [Akkermansia glycaniphila]OCA02125.1 hypothetical protein AC781_13195 [Akkermansia glycaniphila]SEH94552.1 Hypothetical protein PYTT_1962 [Akkermansia glycaniphila]
MKRSILPSAIALFVFAVFLCIKFDAFWRVSVMMTAWSTADSSESACNTFESGISNRTAVERFELVARQYFEQYPDTEIAVYMDMLGFPSFVLQRRDPQTGRYFSCSFIERNDSRSVLFEHSSEKKQIDEGKVDTFQTVDACLQFLASRKD